LKEIAMLYAKAKVEEEVVAISEMAPEEVAMAKANVEEEEQEMAEAQSRKSAMAMLEAEPEDVAMLVKAGATGDGQLKATAIRYAKAKVEEEVVAISEMEP